MSRLAAEHGAVNLGQGFPDEQGPASMVAAAASLFAASLSFQRRA